MPRTKKNRSAKKRNNQQQQQPQQSATNNAASSNKNGRRRRRRGGTGNRDGLFNKYYNLLANPFSSSASLQPSEYPTLAVPGLSRFSGSMTWGRSGDVTRTFALIIGSTEYTSAMEYYYSTTSSGSWTHYGTESAAQNFPSASTSAQVRIQSLGLRCRYMGTPYLRTGMFVVGRLPPAAAGSNSSWVTGNSWAKLLYYPGVRVLGADEISDKWLSVVGQKVSASADNFIPYTSTCDDYEVPFIMWTTLGTDATLLVESASSYDFLPGTTNINLAAPVHSSPLEILAYKAARSAVLDSPGGGVSFMSLGNLLGAATAASAAYQMLTYTRQNPGFVGPARVRLG